VHDYITEQTFALSLKRGIFPLETKAKNRTIAISFLPSFILQGQEADINNIYTYNEISTDIYLLLYTIHPLAYLPYYIMQYYR
jgi:hypothetical protein